MTNPAAGHTILATHATAHHHHRHQARKPPPGNTTHRTGLPDGCEAPLQVGGTIGRTPRRHPRAAGEIATDHNQRVDEPLEFSLAFNATNSGQADDKDDILGRELRGSSFEADELIV